MSLEHTNKVVPLAVSRITQPYETLNYMAVYGLLIIFIYSFLRLILPKRTSSKESSSTKTIDFCTTSYIDDVRTLHIAWRKSELR